MGLGLRVKGLGLQGFWVLGFRQLVGVVNLGLWLGKTWGIGSLGLVPGGMI